MSKIRAVMVFVCLIIASASGGVAAQPYPVRPIRLVVPYAPGGAPDLIARAVAPVVAEHLGQSIAVENRTGANGMIATEFVARGAADGYTLLLASDGPVIITPLLRGEAPANPKFRLAPVTLLADSSFALLAGPSIPATALQPLIALARDRASPLSFASSGIGSQHHLAGELLSMTAQLKLLHIPYKGFGDAVTDVSAGRVDLLFGTIPAAAPHVNNGRLKAIAVAGPARSPLLPGIPTAAEQGLPDLAINAWFGVMAPADTPPEVVKQLDEAFRLALQSAGLRASLQTKLGLNVIGSDRNAYAERIRQDTQQWARIIRASGVKVE